MALSESWSQPVGFDCCAVALQGIRISSTRAFDDCGAVLNPQALLSKSY
jgi:CO/xanthine dehydrogenase Mo-binding subunit